MTARPTPDLIPPHGGYRRLIAYQMAEIVHDATVVFVGRFVDRFSRTRDQMVQAARSGKQNIAEGSQASGTSKRTELRLIGVARASLEELLVDVEDYLRQHDLPQWPLRDWRVAWIRRRSRCRPPDYCLFRRLVEERPAEVAANTLLCLINQTTYLLDQLLRRLGEDFKNHGGATERLYQVRRQWRDGQVREAAECPCRPPLAALVSYLLPENCRVPGRLDRRARPARIHQHPIQGVG